VQKTSKYTLKGRSRTLEDQVVLAPNLTSALGITLHVLSRGRSDVNVLILAETTTAATFPQIVIPCLVCLYSRNGLAASIDIIESDWSYTGVVSKAGIREGCSARAASGR
jgi:hypothetical protein